MNDIVLVANSGWYLKNFRSSTISALIGAGYPVCCLVPFDTSEDVVRQLLELGARVDKVQLHANSTAYWREAVSLLSLLLTLRQRRPALVFSFNPKSNIYCAIVCRLLRVAYVPNISGMGMADQLTGVKGHLYRVAMRSFMRHAFWVFFQNEENRQQFLARGWVEAQRCALLPGSGVDLERFHPVEGKSVSTVRTFLMACRLIKQKGVLEFIRAARKVCAEKGEAARFLLAGELEASERGVDPEVVEAFGRLEQCQFLGHVDDVVGLLQQVDCVVLPSYYPEGVPRILIEAIAMGLPVITTDTPGCREVVDRSRNGYLVAPESVSELYEAMMAFLRLSQDEVDVMASESRRLAESRFDERGVISQYLQVAASATAG